MDVNNVIKPIQSKEMPVIQNLKNVPIETKNIVTNNIEILIQNQIGKQHEISDKMSYEGSMQG